MTDFKKHKFGFIIKGEKGVFYYKEAEEADDIVMILKSDVEIQKIIRPKTTPYNIEELLKIYEDLRTEQAKEAEKNSDLKTIDRLKKKWGLK